MLIEFTYSVSSARPIEVFFFKVLLATEFANLLINIESASILEPSDSYSHLVSLALQTPHLLLRLNQLVSASRILIVDSLEVLLQLGNSFAVLSEQGLLVKVVSLNYGRDLFQIHSQFVTIRENLRKKDKSILNLHFDTRSRSCLKFSAIF